MSKHPASLMQVRLACIPKQIASFFLVRGWYALIECSSAQQEMVFVHDSRQKAIVFLSVIQDRFYSALLLVV